MSLWMSFKIMARDVNMELQSLILDDTGTLPTIVKMCIYVCIYIYICVCVRERERERKSAKRSTNSFYESNGIFHEFNK